MATKDEKGTQPVIHVARLQAKPGRSDDLAARLREVSIASHAEPGCIAYDWHRVVPNDPVSREGATGGVVTAPVEEGMFYSYEVFRDAAALEAHITSPHFRRFFELEHADPCLLSASDVTLERLAPPKQG